MIEGIGYVDFVNPKQYLKIDLLKMISKVQVICLHDANVIPLRHSIMFLQRIQLIHVVDVDELQVIYLGKGYIKTINIMKPDDSDTYDFQFSNDEVVVTRCMTDAASDSIVTSFKVSDVLGNWALMYE